VRGAAPDVRPGQPESRLFRHKERIARRRPRLNRELQMKQIAVVRDERAARNLESLNLDAVGRGLIDGSTQRPAGGEVAGANREERQLAGIEADAEAALEVVEIHAAAAHDRLDDLGAQLILGAEHQAARDRQLPLLELAVRGSTNIPRIMAAMTETMYIQLGTASIMDSPAIKALKTSVAESSM